MLNNWVLLKCLYKIIHMEIFFICNRWKSCNIIEIDNKLNGSNGFFLFLWVTYQKQITHHKTTILKKFQSISFPKPNKFDFFYYIKNIDINFFEDFEFQIEKKNNKPYQSNKNCQSHKKEWNDKFLFFIIKSIVLIGFRTSNLLFFVNRKILFGIDTFSSSFEL